MKMDFPHQKVSSNVKQARERFAELIARASNGQSNLWWQSSADRSLQPNSNDTDDLRNRIDFFAGVRKSSTMTVFGAFVPQTVRDATPLTHGEIVVNRDASAIGKPSFLGSRYPVEPESLRGMEN